MTNIQIQLNKEYRIGTDTYNFILQKLRVQKEGKNEGQEFWENESYHSDLAGVLNAYITAKVKNSDCSNMEELKNFVINIENEIMEITKPLKELRLEE